MNGKLRSSWDCEHPYVLRPARFTVLIFVGIGLCKQTSFETESYSYLADCRLLRVSQGSMIAKGKLRLFGQITKTLTESYDEDVR